MTFEQASLLTSSEKITLVTCEAVHLVKLFQLYSPNVYVRDVSHFVVDVKIDGGSSEQAASINDLSPTNQWFYDAKAKKLYLTTPQDPKYNNVSLVYRFFFSNAPLILPYDLASGEELEWLPIIQSVGSIGQQLDDENTGIVLESQSQIDFINTHGFFDDKFDRLIWENQEVNFYYWFNGLAVSEVKKIFSGVVESKEFQVDKVTFKVKDFVFRLKNKVNLGTFSSLDGTVPDSYLGTSKRRIYGKAEKVKCVPIDAILDGYPLTGTISISTASPTISGTGTQFLKELSPSDEIKVIIQGQEVKLTVDAIVSDTSASLSKNSEYSGVGLSAVVNPNRPYRFKNRRWHIAGHRIRASIAYITNIINARTYIVDYVEEFFAGDTVIINNQTTQISRISGNQIILEQNLGNIPPINTSIVKSPISAVYFNQNGLIYNRDATGLIDDNDSVLEIDELAEFNIAKERQSSVSLKFTNGTRTITTTSTVDLRTIIQSRDWIRRLTSSNSNKWYEVLSVSEQQITLRENFADSLTAGEIFNGIGLIKNTDLIDDKSLILVDCYGKDSGDNSTSGTWIKTASDAVKDLVENDAGFSQISDDSFDQAKSDCDFILSMVIPEKTGEESPLIRDVIGNINESVFGSLYGNSSQEICFSIVNTRRPVDIQPVKDDDILSFSVQTNQKIINQVKINYRPFVDNVNGENSFKTTIFDSDFVNENIGIQNTIEKTCYLYNDYDAEVIAQRTAFYNSLSQSTLTLKAKANFFTSSVNDRCYIELDRLYTRFGGDSKKKIGVISGIKKSSTESEIIMNDLGNIFNRCPVIAPDDLNSFEFASQDEKIKFGYILDPYTNTPDINSEECLGNNLIG